MFKLYHKFLPLKPTSHSVPAPASKFDTLSLSDTKFEKEEEDMEFASAETENGRWCHKIDSVLAQMNVVSLIVVWHLWPAVGVATVFLMNAAIQADIAWGMTGRQGTVAIPAKWEETVEHIKSVTALATVNVVRRWRKLAAAFEATTRILLNWNYW